MTKQGLYDDFVNLQKNSTSLLHTSLTRKQVQGSCVCLQASLVNPCLELVVFSYGL
jgi:hypothetical protein